MSKRGSSGRAARAAANLMRSVTESLETRTMLSGTHDAALLGALASSLQSGAASGLSGFDSRLKDASELGRNLPLIGSGLSSFDPGAQLNSILSRVSSGYTALSQLSSAIEGAAGAADGALVSATRDLPDDLELDLQFSTSKSFTVPINATWGSTFTASGSVSLKSTLSENLTVGAYWDAANSVPVFYVLASNTNIQVATSVTSATMSATASLGFVDLVVSGVSAVFSPNFTFSLVDPNPSADGGKVTAAELTSTPLPQLVNATLGQSAPSSLTASISTSLAPTATQVTFTWADINDPSSVSSNLNTDSALASLKNLENISPATITAGIDTLVGALTGGTTNSVASNVMNKKLPLVNESLNDIINFAQYFKTYLTNFTDATTDPNTGVVTEPFATSNALTLLLQSIPHVGATNVTSHASGSQLIYNINIPETITASYPLALNVGSVVNLNVSGNVSVSVATDVNFSFGVDGSTGTFFVVAPTAPVLTANATMTANVSGAATVGFLGVSVNNGTVSTSASASLSLVDPNLDNPPTPGLITGSEMSSTNLPSLSSLLSVSLTGSANASLPLSSTVPGINPVTLTLAWPDVNDASTFNINTAALSQFLDFNQLSIDSILSYLRQVPTMLTNIAGPSGIGKNIAFLGSSLGKVMNTASVIDNDLTYIQTHDTINSIQDLQSYLDASLGGGKFGLSISNTSELDFTIKVNSQYNGSAGWSIGTSLAGGALSLQSSGNIPISAAFSGQVQFGLNLTPDLNGTTPVGNPTDRFFLVTGSPTNSSQGSSVSASLHVDANNISATATIAFAQVGFTNGVLQLTSKENTGSPATVSAVMGTGAAGSKITLTQILADPTQLFGPVTFDGKVHAFFNLTGLPSSAGSNPNIQLDWSDMSDLSTISITPSFDLSDLNPFANFDPTNFFTGINSIIALVQQWDSQSAIFNTNIPFINKPIKSILDGAASINTILGKVETQFNSVHTPADLESVVLNAVAAAGYSPSVAQITAVSGVDNPSNSTFDYMLSFHASLVNAQFPFQWGNSLFTLAGNINVSAGFTTNIEFGFNKTDGFYIVGNNDAAHPQVSLTGSVIGTFDRIGGMFGPLSYGVSNGSAGLNYAIGANLSESSTNGAKIPATDILTNALSIFHPVFTGSGNLNLPIAFRLGSGTFGPAVTTTFTASWDPNRQNQLGFGPNDSSDPADGFGAVNYDIGEFIDGIVNPILADIKQYDIIPSQITDLLNYQLPLINETIGQVLGDYEDNAGLKLLTQISGLISQEPQADPGSVDISHYFQPGTQPVGTDPGSPTGNTSNGTTGVFKSFQQTLQNDFDVKLPILASPASTIISILTGKDVDLIQFDPGYVSISQTWETPALVIPLASIGVADVSAFISGGLTATLFANVNMGLSTRGLLGHEIGGGVNLLDGFYIDDSAQYQAGVSLDVHLTVGGQVDVFAYSAVKLYGQVHAVGTVGVHVNDLYYNTSTGLPVGIANYNGSGAGDNRAYLDEIEYIAGNDGLLCAIMPGGSLGLEINVAAQVNLVFTSITLFNIGYTVTIANYNYPCVPQLATLANIQGNQLVMVTDPSTDGKNISATLKLDSSGNPAGIHLTESNQGTILYQDFTLAQLTSANVTTLVMNGTAGNDTFTLGPALTKQTPIRFLVVYTGQGNDQVDLTNLTTTNSTLLGATITGGDGTDTIHGTYAPDTISLGNGINSVFVGTAAALVIEHAGNDTINGGNGNVTVNGGTGSENVLLGDGNNIINAGSGSDTIDLGNGNNQVFASSGAESINLGDGKNLVTAGSGTDTITAGNGDNKLYGDNGGSSITVGLGQNIIYGGSGNDSITAGGGNDFINPGTGNDTVNGGSGNTLLEISANANQTLAPGLVTINGLGSTTFSNITSVALTGGAGNNSFNVSAWNGNPVQITGGGGTDTVISSANTDYTLGDGSLVRSDGVRFSLSGISAANLTGGPSDNTFDLTNWHGTATLTGGGGIDELLENSVVAGNLTNTAFTRSGAGSVALSSITRAQLSTSTTGSTTINAATFTGDVALFGQGSNNTLTGGTGSDYIVGGSGGDTLIGNGTTDNQILGGSGSSEHITGGPGTNLLVGSTGGLDTITVGSGSNRVYTPGGNDTIHAETGHAIVFAFGTGDSVLTGSSTTDQIVHPGDAGTVASDFVAPAADLFAWPKAPSASSNTLPTGVDSSGQWAEDEGSASSGGISNSIGSGIEPSVISTGSGASAITYVAWADNRNGVYEIFVAKHLNGVWSELAGSAHGLGISGTTGGRKPSIALDSSGNPIVAWVVGGVIKVAHYDPTANSGAGGWVAYGTSLGSTGINGDTTGDTPKIVYRSTGPVVAWLDSSSGAANVYVQSFNGTSWATVGSYGSSGLSASSSSVTGLSLATDGTKLAVAYSQTVSSTTVIYLKQFISSWAGVSGSDAGSGFTVGTAAVMPSVVYFSGSLYVAYSSVVNGAANIQVTTSSGAAWTPVTIQTPISAGANQVSRGAATSPVLAVNGNNMDLVWVEDRLNTTPDQAVAIYANRFSGGAFMWQLPGDSSFDGILRRSTSLSSATALALTVDASGHPFVAWGDTSSGSSQIYGLSDTLDVTKIIYVNDGLTANDSYSTAAGAASNNGLTPSTPLDTLQAALNLAGLGAGTVILVDSGTYAGNVTIGTGDNGVMIMGSPGAPTSISGLITVNSAQNVTLKGLLLAGGATINNGNHIELVNDTSGNAAQVAQGTGGQITLTGTNITLEHDSFAGVTLAGTTNTTIINNTISGAGIAVTIAANGLVISGNTLAKLSLGATSQGSIFNNNIVGGGLSITQAFTGVISGNLIHGGSVGVIYAAAALLNNNRIYGNSTGIVDTLNSPTLGLGFVTGSTPNQIFGNAVGVNLTGSMQGQHIAFNTVGVTGSGTLGGTSLDSGNLIEANGVGAQFSGTVQYDRFSRNQRSIAVNSGQLIDHNVFLNNAGANIETLGASDVRIINNTFYSTVGDNVRIDGTPTGSSNVQVLNNIMWATSGYDINVDSGSTSGFFSDYNDLYTSGSGKIVHYQLDFTDILDWQDDVNLFDLHSIGTESINLTGALPRFVDLSLGDARVFVAAAGVRSTSPTANMGDAAIDLGLPAGYTNLLQNSSFENGLTSWTSTAGEGTQSSSPAAFNGSSYFTAGSLAAASIQQTVALPGGSNQYLIFGGRIQSAAESIADQGKLTLTFQDSNHNTIGTPDVLSAKNVNGRWELVSDRIQIPAGAAFAVYRFDALRESGSTNDSFLDGTFMYVTNNSDTVSLGGFGGTVAERSTAEGERILLHSPDLYVNWELNKAHQILWSTYGNTTNAPVEIDLYQNGTFLQTITSSTADTGSYTWIPSSGLTAGMFGLQIKVSIAGTPAISDLSSETFAIPQAGTTFYVNDRSTTGDEYSTVAGNNRATGKTPGAALPLLTTLLREYSLDATSTVYIDTGTYNHFAPVELSGNPTIGSGQGVTIIGAVNHSSSINTIGFTSPAVFDINAGSFVTISHIATTGGDYGFWVHGGGTNFNGSNLTVTGGRLGGIRLESDATNSILDHITTSGDGGDGLYVGGTIIQLTNSTSFNNSGSGFEVGNSGTIIVTGDVAYNNTRDGLYIYQQNGALSTIVGTTSYAPGLGNLFYNNGYSGIEAYGNGFTGVTVAGNTVYGQTAFNDAGIRLGGGARGIGNVVYNNYNGILSSGGLVANNRSYNNSNNGIEVDSGASAIGNVVFNNYIGIDANDYNVGASIKNNLAYNNTLYGIWEQGGQGSQIDNNTVYQTTGVSLKMDPVNSGTTQNNVVENNILWASGTATALVVATVAEAGIHSDFNDLYAVNGGTLATWENVNRTTLQAWQFASGLDANSISTDPLFVNVAGGDFHEKSTAGSYHGGSLAPVLGSNNLPTGAVVTLTADTSLSPTIDRGDPSFDFSQEPTPNGGFINQGAFGNTAQASLSLTSYVQVLQPQSGGVLVDGQTTTIQWRSQDTTGTVNIDLMVQGNNTPVLSIASGVANSGTYSWSIPTSVTPGATYIIRVTRNTNTAVGTTGIFTINAATHIYYVNDSTVTAGDLTTAPGNDSNTGLDAAHPKASVQGVLSAYSVGAGDIIKVDRGIYGLTTSVVISATNAGVTIQGYTNSSQASQWPSSVVASGPVEYYRLNDASGTVAADSSGHGASATYVGSPALGQPGAFGIGDTSASFNGNNYVQLPAGQSDFSTGFSFEVWANPSASSYYAAFFSMSDAGPSNYLTLRRSGTGNDLDLVTSKGTVTASNVLQDGVWQFLAVTIGTDGSVTFYKNGSVVGSGTMPVQNTAARPNVTLGQSITGGASNYVGQMQEAAFFNRAETATEIQNRYLLSSTMPVFVRNNTGADVFTVLANNVTIDHVGMALGNIGVDVGSNVTGLTVSNSDISGMVTSGVYLNTGDNGAVIHNNSIHGVTAFYQAGIYVNASDVTISGNSIFDCAYAAIAGNNGLNSLITGNNIFGNYSGINLDTVTISQNSVHDNYIYGINATINTLVTGNTVFNNTGSPYGAGILLQQGLATGNVTYGNQWGIYGANTYGTANDNLVYGNLAGGIYVDNDTNFNGNVVYNNTGYGVYVNVSPYGPGGGSLTNSVIYGNTVAGIGVANAIGFLVQNNTIYQTVGDAITVTGATNGLVLRDNILWATTGADVRVAAAAQPAVASDYNDLYVTGTGVAGNSNGINYATLASWIDATGFDLHSISADPLFVSAATGDFHEQSIYGSFHGGSLAPVLSTTTGLPVSVTATLTTDASQSPAIDAGNPTDAFNLEPSPNGGYVNLGAYGNTAQASLSATQYLIMLNPQAGQIFATGQTYPVQWRTQDHAGTVEIDLLDGQGHLVSVIAAAATNSGTYNWLVPTALSTGSYMIRVIRSDGAGTGTGAVFSIAGSTGIYYVNDGTTQVGDWTTAPGNNANSGLDPAHPKASISAILAAYQLSAGNVIMVDNGTYTLTTNITLPAADSGITIEGFTGAAPVLNRNNTNSGSEVFDLAGAQNVTIQNFELINGYDVIDVNDNSGSTGATFRQLNIHSFYGSGIYVGPGNNGAVIDSNQIHDGVSGGGYQGIYTNGTVQITVTNNNIYDLIQYAIHMPSAMGSVISGNTIHNADTGVYGDTMNVTGNTVYNIGSNGIYIYQNGNVSGNTIYNVGGGSYYQAGIVISSSNAMNNVVYNCVVGAIVQGSATLSNSRIYNCSQYGVFAQYGSTVTCNTIYSNAGGVFAGGIMTISNNLIYGNTAYGIQTVSIFSAVLTGNTIYQPTGDGIDIFNGYYVPSSVVISGNIIWTQSGRDINVDDSQVPGIQSDYNDLYATGTGVIGLLGGQTFATLAAWTTELGQDRHSISFDPMFNNALGADGVLGFSGGVDHGVDDNFRIQTGSPTIDAADPTYPYSNEPTPNGGRANLGYTGNSALATASSAQSIQLITPVGRVQTGQTVPITWSSNGLVAPNPNSAATTVITSQSPVVYLKLDETSGTTAVDSSGNGLNGVYANSPALGDPGAFGAGNGTAVGFNGGTNNVSVTSAALDLKRSVTMSAWIKPSTLAPQWQAIFYKGGGQYYNRTYTMFLNTSGSILLSSWDGSAERALQTPGGLVQPNVWTFVSVVMDRNNGTAAIYINGNLAASAAAGSYPAVDAVDSASTPLYIGYSPESSAFGYFGDIDEAAVYSTAKTAADVSTQFAATRGTFHVDLLNTSGTVVQSIATGVRGSYYGWTVPTSLAAGSYRIRVTSDLTGAASGVSQPFSVVTAGHDYYVNDGSLTGDVTDTAVGNNANDGKSANSPMSSIEAIIHTYHPGAGDTIHVENGTYTIFQDINLFADDSGLTIQGPTTPGKTATISRGGTIDTVFNFTSGTQNITIDHLSLTGSDTAINASANLGVNNVTISNDTIYGNADKGIFDGDNNTGWVITGNTVHDNTGGSYLGIEVYNTYATISNNIIYNEGNYGIYVLGRSTGQLPVISGNTVYANGYGIYAYYANVTGNLAHDNGTAGIYANTGVLAVGNTVWRQTAGGAVGIEVSGGEARGNVIYGNYNGLWLRGADTVDDNRVYSNTNYGIYVNGGTESIYNNLIYDNSNGGVYFLNTYAGGTITNNTIYQPVNDAINMSNSPGNVVRNNILWVEAGYDLDIAANSQSGFVSDYNDLHHGTGANANVGFWNGAAAVQLSDWKTASGMDAHSVAGDPLFVSITGADSIAGYNPTANNGNGYDGGGDDNFILKSNSPAIGAGLASAAPSTDLLGQTRTSPPDMGAYAFTGSNSDTTPPTVTGTTPAGINSSGSVLNASSVTVNFSEPINPIDALAVSVYDLRSAGPDGIFDTTDDVIYAVTPVYTPGSTSVTLNFTGGNLPTGSYRLRVLGTGSTTIHDLAGNALASTYSRSFSVSVSSPVTLSSQAQYIRLNGSNIDVFNNSTGTGTPIQSIALGSITTLTANQAAGSTPFVIDLSAGNPLPSGGFIFNGNGTGGLKIIGSASISDTIVFGSTQMTVDGVTITLNTPGTVRFQPGTGTDSITVNSGTLDLAGTTSSSITVANFSNISVASGATLKVEAPANQAGRYLLSVNSLSIAGATNAWTGRLDLGSNDLDLPGANITQVLNQLQSGYANGLWNGTGIDSSAAAGDAAHLHTLGAIVNNDGLGHTLYGAGTTLGTFDTTSPGSNDVLLKYTYYGDANLDGVVNATDYTRIDNGYLTHLTSWFNGDFNGDHVVNGSDYTLIDNAFNMQGASTTASIAVTIQAQYIRLSGANINVYNNSTGTGTPIQSIALSSVSVLTVNQIPGSSPFVIDLSAGNPIPTGGLIFNGNGIGGLNIIGSASINDTIVFGTASMTVDGVGITLNTPGTVRFQPGAGTDSITVNSGTLDLTGTTGSGVTVANFSSISVAAAATLKVEAPAVQTGRYLLSVNSLSIAGSTNAWTGRLDVGSNDLDLPGANITQVLNQALSGYANGQWNGTGIDSSSLAGDSTHLHTLGAIVNNDGQAHPVYSPTSTVGKFDTTSPGLNDVLVKYTYWGDTNLDGAVDSADYARIDNAFLSHATGWYNGDFNGDHVINGSDYTLIDNAFNKQGAKVLAMVADQIASGPAAKSINVAIFNSSNPISNSGEAKGKSIAQQLFDSVNS